MDRNLFSNIGIKACEYLNGGFNNHDAAIRAACLDINPANHSFLVFEFKNEVMRRAKPSVVSSQGHKARF